MRKAWDRLDELQKAAIAEVVHSAGTEFDAERFSAKYGRLPDFGTVNKWSRDGRPTPLRFFFFGRESGGGFMPADLLWRRPLRDPPGGGLEIRVLSLAS
ncbi:MAG TPA: hypothetical protein DFS52_03260 [Myxococcales bacterium]|nr:hypothetical protein [Myxococcales bacterium]